MTRPLRVIHCGTGTAGARALGAILDDPGMQLVGLLGHGEGKHGQDAGTLAGRPAVGVLATSDVARLVALGADLGLAVDEVRETREFVLAGRAYDIAAGPIAAGTVAGQRWRWSGVVEGRERVVQETYWFTAFDLGPGYPQQGELADDTLWRVTLEGEPSLRCTVEPRVSFADASARGDNPSALATAMAAVNALPAVCAARSGLLGAADLKVRDMPSRLRRDR